VDWVFTFASQDGKKAIPYEGNAKKRRGTIMNKLRKMVP